MVANITTGKDIYGALAYNQCKVDRGKGAVLATSNIREPADGRFGVAALADELLRWMPRTFAPRNRSSISRSTPTPKTGFRTMN